MAGVDPSHVPKGLGEPGRLAARAQLLDPALRAVELRDAELVELLAALPERDRLVEGDLPCSSRVTICSSSRSASSNDGSVNRRSERAVGDLDLDLRAAASGRVADDAVAASRTIA